MKKLIFVLIVLLGIAGCQFYPRTVEVQNLTGVTITVVSPVQDSFRLTNGEYEFVDVPPLSTQVVITIYSSVYPLGKGYVIPISYGIYRLY
jgi:hypothetical protein